MKFVVVMDSDDEDEELGTPLLIGKAASTITDSLNGCAGLISVKTDPS